MKYFFFSILLSYTMTSNCQEIQFAKPFEISQGTIEGVSALDVADFNEDGLLDIAIFDGGAHSGGKSKAVWYEQKSENSWIRHGFGHESIIGSNDMNDFVGAMKCGDIDNDGDVDLIVSVDGHKVGPIIIYGFINPGKSKVNQPWPKVTITTIPGWHCNDMALDSSTRRVRLTSPTRSSRKRHLLRGRCRYG